MQPLWVHLFVHWLSDAPERRAGHQCAMLESVSRSGGAGAPYQPVMKGCGRVSSEGGFSSKILVALVLLSGVLPLVISPAYANEEAKKLYEDLLSTYNRLIRPVGNNSDRLTVKLGLKLSQLIDVVSGTVISL